MPPLLVLLAPSPWRLSLPSAALLFVLLLPSSGSASVPVALLPPAAEAPPPPPPLPFFVKWRWLDADWDGSSGRAAAVDDDAEESPAELAEAMRRSDSLCRRTPLALVLLLLLLLEVAPPTPPPPPLLPPLLLPPPLPPPPPPPALASSARGGMSLHATYAAATLPNVGMDSSQNSCFSAAGVKLPGRGTDTAMHNPRTSRRRKRERTVKGQNYMQHSQRAWRMPAHEQAAGSCCERIVVVCG